MEVRMTGTGWAIVTGASVAKMFAPSAAAAPSGRK
jgi:hypothetical protein